MNFIRIVVLSLMLLANHMNAQFSEDFSDDELRNNPTWVGDLGDFVTNQDGELQLNANDGGSSSIYTAIRYNGDISWETDFSLDFSPSGSNQLSIFLLALNPDPSMEASLWIEIGETGSDDAISLYTQNSDTPIATGMAGRFASEPSGIIRATLSNSGMLTVMSKLDSENAFVSEFNVEIPDILFGDYFFGLQCDYTSTRSDKFFFRSIIVSGVTEDLAAPVLIESLVNNDQICLRFNEFLDEDLSLQELVIQVDNVVNDNVNFNGAELKINNDGSIPEGDFDISLTGLSDQAGNRLDTSISVFLPVLPIEGELVINELLFDPVSGGDDFLEILNNSDKTFDLNGLGIMNTQSGNSVTVNQSIIMRPLDIVAFSTDIPQLIDMYPSANPDNIINQALPSFPNGGGTVEIEMNGRFLDMFVFSDDIHNTLLDDTEGVSLERTDPNGQTDDLNLWSSASETSGFATPGATNSTLRVDDLGSSELVMLSSHSFSPNGDGDNDQLEIVITPQANSVGSVIIYDQSGNTIQTLRRNTLLGSQDSIIWDGRLANGSRAPIGLYIIRVEVFDTIGQVFDVKKVVALVDFIN